MIGDASRLVVALAALIGAVPMVVLGAYLAIAGPMLLIRGFPLAQGLFAIGYAAHVNLGWVVSAYVLLRWKRLRPERRSLLLMLAGFSYVAWGVAFGRNPWIAVMAPSGGVVMAVVGAREHWDVRMGLVAAAGGLLPPPVILHVLMPLLGRMLGQGG